MKAITTKYGFLLFLVLSVFFISMNALNLSHHLYLRVFNGVIHLAILTIAIYKYRQINKETLGNYISGVVVGLYTSLIGSVLFGGFFATYLYFDQSFKVLLSNYIPLSDALIPIAAAMFIVMEGIAVGLVGSYLITRVINVWMVRKNINKRYAQSAEWKVPVKE